MQPRQGGILTCFALHLWQPVRDLVDLGVRFIFDVCSSWVEDFE